MTKEERMELCKQLALLDIQELVPIICYSVELWCAARKNEVSPKEIMRIAMEFIEIAERKD